MLLYLVQHGWAFSKEEDPERGLTDQGKSESRKTGEFLRDHADDIHVIWHSGRKRSRETAEIIAGVLGIPERILEHTYLGPNDPVSPVHSELKKAARDKIIVGHLPYLCKLASSLLTGYEDQLSVSFINSGICCLEKNEGKWTMKWAVTPQMFK